MGWQTKTKLYFPKTVYIVALSRSHSAAAPARPLAPTRVCRLALFRDLRSAAIALSSARQRAS